MLLNLLASPLNNNGYNLLVSHVCAAIGVRLTSCGMMESLERRSLSPIEAISMLHSSQIGLKDERRDTLPPTHRCRWNQMSTPQCGIALA